MSRRILMLAAVLLAGCSSSAGRSPDPASSAEALAAAPALPEDASTGRRAPAFQLAPASGGAALSLADAVKGAKGAPTVLVLGSASCSYSRQEMGDLTAAKPAYRVVAVISGTPAEVKGSLPKEVPFPVLVDGDGSVLSLYRVNATPSVVVLDGAGTVAYIGGGGYLPPELVADLAGRVARGEPVDGGSVKTQGG